MYGRKVYEFALNKVPLAIQSCLEASGESIDSVSKTNPRRYSSYEYSRIW